jgi:hypothetical protein
MLKLCGLGQEHAPLTRNLSPSLVSGDDIFFNAGSNASMNDSGASHLEPMFFRTFRWLFDGVTFRTEGTYLLLPIPTLYRRKPIVKDVRIKKRGDVVLSRGQYNPTLKHPNGIEDLRQRQQFT